MYRARHMPPCGQCRGGMMMDGSTTELEPTLEKAAHALARQRRDLDSYAGLALTHGPEDAARIWLRATWLRRQGIEEEVAA